MHVHAGQKRMQGTTTKSFSKKTVEEVMAATTKKHNKINIDRQHETSKYPN